MTYEKIGKAVMGNKGTTKSESSMDKGCASEMYKHHKEMSKHHERELKHHEKMMKQHEKAKKSKSF